MSRPGHWKRKINIEKAATLSMVLNGIEVVVLIALLIVSIFDWKNQLIQLIRPVYSIVLVFLIFEGVMSMRDAFIWRKTNRQTEMILQTWQDLDNLNTQLRKQRHDFLNHLQVVYSLVDMNENGEATRYIENVYGQMQRLSAVMKTDKPAINALLQAKLATAEHKGVQFVLDVRSPLSQLPINDWEMCRVLGNLIDNAMDALEGTPSPTVRVELTEDLKTYTFRVINNGPHIPESMQSKIFSTGFTTKDTGHGLGLSIVQEIMETYCGNMVLASREGETTFTGTVPKIVQVN